MMQTVKQKYTVTIEVNRSKFITHLVPISEYKRLQDKLKKEHPKANHMVYALRYLNQFDQVVEDSSDDGEPKGCAGIPSLNVLRGKNLINCAILTIRYFGGIKLGTGGMARAYALAVKEVLAASDLVLYEKQMEYIFDTSYAKVDKILYQLKQLDITQYERDFAIDKVVWKIVGTKEKIEQFKRL